MQPRHMLVPLIVSMVCTGVGLAQAIIKRRYRHITVMASRMAAECAKPAHSSAQTSIGHGQIEAIRSQIQANFQALQMLADDIEVVLAPEDQTGNQHTGRSEPDELAHAGQTNARGKSHPGWV